MTFKEKIEDMDYFELKKITEESYHKEMPAIRLISYIGLAQSVECEYNELTALCPMTGLPDFYKLKLRYVPKTRLIELKSLKIYLTAFREVPISHEHLASKIYDEVSELEGICQNSVGIILEVAVRGGIRTKIRMGAYDEIE